MTGLLKVIVKDGLGARVPDALVSVRLLTQGGVVIYPAGFGVDTAIGSPTISTGGVRVPSTYPFLRKSPFIRPLGANANYLRIQNSRAPTFPSGGYANIEGYTINAYIVSGADPVRTIWQYDSSQPGTGSLDIDPGTALVSKGTTRIPDAARPSWGLDAHLTLVTDQAVGMYGAGTWRSVEFGRAVRMSGAEGTPPQGAAGDIRYVRNGNAVVPDLMTHDGIRPQHLTGTAHAWVIAGGMSSLAMLVRDFEVANGTDASGEIRHALQLIVYPYALNKNVPNWNGQWPSCVWPATISDPFSGYNGDAPVYMGSCLAIPPSVNIESLGISDAQAKRVLRALQRFGGYIVDTGDPGETGRIVIRIDEEARDTVSNLSTFQSGLSIGLRQVQVVTNAHDQGQEPSWYNDESQGVGGGAPIYPMAPSF